MDESLKSWFLREILAHEESLVRYLTRIWPWRDEVHDLRQEAYVRVFEAAKVSRPQSPKSFLFTTARHLMADRIRRQRIVSIEALGDLEIFNLLVDELSPEYQVESRQELRRLALAFDQLPPRCREAVWMRRVDDLSQKEVANRLGISPRTVEKHVMKGMQILADCLFGARSGASRSQIEAAQNEAEHGKQQAN